MIEIERIIKGLLNNKPLLSGIAIFLVMLYHQPSEGVVKGVYFYPGFVGVDIFMLLSGYGLCFSISKNNTIEFYKRRLLRIFPLLLIMGFIVSFNYADYNVWDYVCNMTSLYYYRLGGDVYEWYLAALILFYLAFPLLYCSIDRLTRISIGSSVVLVVGGISCNME